MVEFLTKLLLVARSRFLVPDELKMMVESVRQFREKGADTPSSATSCSSKA